MAGYDSQLYEAYGYSLNESDARIEALERDYKSSPDLHTLLKLNAARHRAGLLPIFDLSYGKMMLEGIRHLIGGVVRSDGNWITVNGGYRAGLRLIAVNVLLHNTKHSYSVLKILFGRNVNVNERSILFDVRKTDGDSVFFGAIKSLQHPIVSRWYMASPDHVVIPSPSWSWMYDPKAMLKWIYGEYQDYNARTTESLSSPPLIESDQRIRELEREWASTKDTDVAKRLEAAHYRVGDYIAARRVRLAYNPYMIMLARTKIIPAQGMNAPLRIVLYLKEIYNNRPEFVTWVYNEQSKGKGQGAYFHSFTAAENSFWDRYSRESGTSTRHASHLDKLPDGYPSSLTIYRNL